MQRKILPPRWSLWYVEILMYLIGMVANPVIKINHDMQTHYSHKWSSSAGI